MTRETADDLYWELKRIEKKNRLLGNHSLAKPRQQGWLIEFRVRDDIMRSREAHNYSLILPWIQSRKYSKTTIFRDKPFVKSIRAENKDKTGFPEFFWGKYFSLREDLSDFYWNGITKKPRYIYKINRPWVFEHIIRPKWVTSVPIIDPELDSRSKEIRNRIQNADMGSYLHKKFGYWYGKCRCFYCRLSKVNRNKMIFDQEIKEFKNEYI